MTGSDLAAALAALTGNRWPGGCEDCDAYQTISNVDGVFVLAVHHDDGCPFYDGVTR